MTPAGGAEAGGSARIGAIELDWDPDSPPMVRATAARLAEKLADPEFADRTGRASGVVVISQAGTPQAVTIRLDGGTVSLAHGSDDGAELRASLDPHAPGEKPALEGAGEYAELADWLARLLEPAAISWEDAAARFWSVLERLDGAPAALVAVNLDSGEERRFGTAEGRTVEIHAPGEALVCLFTAEITLMEGAYDGSVLMRGGFPDLSLFAGAAYELRYGGSAAR